MLTNSDCALDDTCVQCARCFQASNHANHNVTFVIHTLGCGSCDCGDNEAWRQSVHCAHHPFPSTLPSKPKPTLPDGLVTALDETLLSTLCALLIIFNRSPAVPNPPKSFTEVESEVDPNESLNGITTNTKGPWSCVLWNDEKHNFNQVIDQVMKALGKEGSGRDSAVKVAMQVDRFVGLFTSIRIAVLKLNRPCRVER